MPEVPRAEAPVPRSRRRRRLLLGWLAATCVVAIAVTVTVAFTSRSGTSRSGPGRAAAPASSGPPLSVSSRSSPPDTPDPVLATPGPRPPDDTPGPIVLVPGYGGSDAMLAALADRLTHAGRSTIALSLPDDATGDLRGQADVLAARVAVALKAGAPSVDLVGYSAGGIVVALFVAAHPQEVRRVVTIGAPLHGTELAGLAAGFLPSACPSACQQMVPGSPLLATLDAASPARTGVAWTSMWTTHDQVVSPPDSARFTGATNIVLQDVCADDTVTHIDLPADPLVAALTLRGLGATGQTSPTASDCAALRAEGAG